MEYAATLKQKLASARREGLKAIRAVEQTLGNVEDQESGVIVDLFLSYRAVQAWPEMVALVDKMSRPLRETVIMGKIKEPPPVLRHLAEIRGFTLFVSTTPDLLLEAAINDTRFGGLKRVTSLEYSLNERSDLPQTSEELKDLANISPPLVFHQFGKISPIPNSCALTEEDLLEFFYDFQKHEDTVENLLTVLRSRQLLFLGTTWPDWFNRFFLRNAHRERLTKKEQIDYLVGDRLAREQTFVGFLQDFTNKNTTRVLPVDPAAFISALRDQWVASYPPDPKEPIPLPETMAEDSLFISYAREDERAVECLRTGLEEARLKVDGREVGVWFDKKQLTIGSDWKDKITKNLKKCLFFLPVVSKHTEKAVKDRYFREEWTQAVERVRRDDSSYEFILLIKLDRGPHDKLPQTFLDKKWVHLPDGKVTQEFIELIRALVAKRGRERHGK